MKEKMEKKEKCCIIIPELSKKYSLFIFFIIGSLFRKMIPSILSDYVFKIQKGEIEFNEERRVIYFDIVCNILSDLLTGILHCFSEKYKPKSKRKKKEERLVSKSNKNKKDLKIKYIVYYKKKNIFYLLKIIFIISLIDFICQLLLFGNCFIKRYEKFNDKNNKNTIIRNADHLYSFLVIDIVSRYLFSLLILKTHFYEHHYLSFFLNFIALSFFFFIDKVKKIEYYDIYYIITIILQYVFYSLEDILNKVALMYLFINPESLLFYKGLFSFGYLIIFTIVLYFYDDIGLPTIDKDFYANIICRLYFIVFNIIRSFYLVKVIDVFSSQHISFLRVFETIVLFIFYKFDSYYKGNIKEDYLFDNYFVLQIYDNFIEVGAFLILFFSTLIHNEIIILNCHRFKKSTIYFLNIEAEKEKNDINLEDSGNDNSVEVTQTISSINESNEVNEITITNTSF